MLILIIGGSGSGKSEYAERRCMELDAGQKLYIATMEVYDEESLRRVARHRQMRSGKGFDTLECYTHLEEIEIPAGRTVLLECMSNLVANEMFSASGRCRFSFIADENGIRIVSEETGLSAAKKLVLQGVKRLVQQASNVVIVTNQVFSDGISYDAETEKYRKNLAAVNQAIAAIADEVVEVVCGIPIILKSERAAISPECI